MKLTEEELALYYLAQGIDRSDLISARPLDLSELPRDAPLDEDARGEVSQIIELWNGMDDLTKIDAAQSLERRVLRGRDDRPCQLVNAWGAYLLLGRLRDCEERREIVRRIALGELAPASLRQRRPGRPRRH